MSSTAKFLQFLVRAIEQHVAHGPFKFSAARIALERRARVLADRIIQGRA